MSRAGDTLVPARVTGRGEWEISINRRHAPSLRCGGLDGALWADPSSAFSHFQTEKKTLDQRGEPQRGNDPRSVDLKKRNG